LELVKVLKTLMSLRGLTQVEVAKSAGISRAALVRYLSGDSELQSDSLHRVLAVMGVNVEAFLMREVAKALGADEGYSIGEDLNAILQNAKPIERRTIVDFLVARLKGNNSPETKTRLARIKRFAESIETVRRGN
jgi:transcriptional regulator with XRE-family HTH domain